MHVFQSKTSLVFRFKTRVSPMTSMLITLSYTKCHEFVSCRFNADTRPACLPDATHRYTVGEMCYLPGWGSTSSKTFLAH